MRVALSSQESVHFATVHNRAVHSAWAEMPFTTGNGAGGCALVQLGPAPNQLADGSGENIADGIGQAVQ